MSSTFPLVRSELLDLWSRDQDLRTIVLDAVTPRGDGVPLGGETYRSHKRRSPTQR